MKTLVIKFIFLSAFLLSQFTSNAQIYALNKSESSLIVYGTSSLHDWQITAEDQQGLLELDDTNKLKISKLKLTVNAESLKSGKKAMDKNTYKALNTKTYKNINFEMIRTARIKQADEFRYELTLLGELTVAGTTKPITLQVIVKRQSSKIEINGNTTFLMTDFNVEPPKALLGTIKTGDEITLKFNSVFTK